MSLQALANMSHVSKSMISQIENGQVNPTLAVIWKLAAGLGMSLHDLFDGEVDPEEKQAFTLLTEANCPTLASREKGYRIQILSTIEMVDKAELYLLELQPGGVLDSRAHPPGATETITVIQGTVKIEIPGEAEQKLGALQSARYSADREHVISNPGKGVALAYLAGQFATVATIPRGSRSR